MKIVQINSVSYGSTGNIMLNIHKKLLKLGHESYVIWGRGKKSNNNNEIFMNDKLGVYFHAVYSRLTGKTGFASKNVTKKLIKIIDKIDPDIIHLHNIHGYYLNIEILFNYLKKKKVKVIWTLHDCWTFTGHCPYFDIVNCNKWKIKCNNCPQKKEYPKSLIDNSSWCYDKKKELFVGLTDLTIVTPSEWLSHLVKKSFLKDYNVLVINNGIDTDIFKKRDLNAIDFKRKYGINNQKIILGVASPWSKRKGLSDFIELSERIDNEYKIVLVGLTKNQIKHIPEKIIGLERTKNAIELANIYNYADIFLNPTYEDNYPTTNLEAAACGLPVITYNTGGSPESMLNFGIVLNEKKVDCIINALKKNKIKLEKLKKLSQVKFDKTINSMVDNYIKLYETSYK